MLVAVFLALFVVFIGWATRLIFQARDIKRKSDLRIEAAAHLAEALRKVEEGSPESSELLREASREVDELDRDE